MRDHFLCLLVTNIDLKPQSGATHGLDLDRAVGGHVVRLGLEFLI
jgi:hypothetical protein